jgi:hypothetical protein
MKLTGVVKIDAGYVFDWISCDMRISIKILSLTHTIQRVPAVNRAAITFATVAPAPVALLIVGESGFETSPIAKTNGTFVSC